MLAFSLIAQLYMVPFECQELARREGFKLEMTEEEATKARKRLTWLRTTRPWNKEVKTCSEAVERMKSG